MSHSRSFLSVGGLPAVLCLPAGSLADDAILFRLAADARLAATDRELKAEAARREPPPIPVERQLEVVTAFRSAAGRSYAVGTLVDREAADVAPVVKEHPGAFRYPGRPLEGA